MNVLSNPHVGLIYFVPGRTDTLRINGRARIVKEAPFFDDMVVKGNRPQLALLVEIEQIFHHCSKSFMRSKLWKPETWNPDALPRRAVISQTFERPDDDLETLDQHYGPQYEASIYKVKY
jgi:predicted pyridoxine 5'-phosphate oxidase superfamily flavin-nucleotide-binding protein